MSNPKVLICPYCGEAQPVGEACRSCAGLFEKYSRQATHNAMGPWFIRDAKSPYRPGCSYETLVGLIERGLVTKTTILRGPTTTQFWTVARRVPGIAHLLGYCHQCNETVDSNAHGCPACGVPFGPYLDRNFLGLPEIRPLPWEADADDDSPLGRNGGPSLRPPARPVGMPDFGGGATPGGRLSSFATNDELLRNETQATGTMDSPAAPGPSAAPAAAPVEVEPESAPARPVASFETNPATVRALQRRLAQQSRTIRTMTVLLVIGFVGLVATMIPVARQLVASKDSPTNTNAATPVETPSSPGDGAPSADPVADDLEAVSTPGDDEASATAPAVLPEPAPETAPETAGGTIDDTVDESAAAPRSWSAEWDRIQALKTFAADKANDRAERIKACEEAVALLDTIAAGTPADQQPPGLAEERDRLSRRLERLKLEDFFP